MTEKITARERFRAVFEHDASNLDRLPMLSLGTPIQGLFYQEWIKKVAEDIPDEMVRLTRFGDKTLDKWIGSEWHNSSVGYPTGYPRIPLPKDHPEWDNLNMKEGEDLEMTIGWAGQISVSGKKMHGESYGWYQNGYFTRQKKESGEVLAPWEV